MPKNAYYVACCQKSSLALTVPQVHGRDHGERGPDVPDVARYGL